MTGFVCSECGGLSNDEELATEMLDSGATLTCSQCGKKTIVLLCTSEEYNRRVNKKGGDV